MTGCSSVQRQEGRVSAGDWLHGRGLRCRAEPGGLKLHRWFRASPSQGSQRELSNELLMFPAVSSHLHRFNCKLSSMLYVSQIGGRGEHADANKERGGKERPVPSELCLRVVQLWIVKLSGPYAVIRSGSEAFFPQNDAPEFGFYEQRCLVSLQICVAQRAHVWETRMRYCVNSVLL